MSGVFSDGASDDDDRKMLRSGGVEVAEAPAGGHVSEKRAPGTSGAQPATCR